MEASRLSGKKRDVPDSLYEQGEQSDLVYLLRCHLDKRFDVVCDKEVVVGTFYTETIEKWSHAYDTTPRMTKYKVVEAVRKELADGGCRFFVRAGKQNHEAFYQEIHDEKIIKARIQRNLRKHATETKNALIKAVMNDIMSTQKSDATTKAGVSRQLMTRADLLSEIDDTSAGTSFDEASVDTEHIQVPPPPLLERNTTYNPIPIHDYNTAPNPNSTRRPSVRGDSFSQMHATEMDFWFTSLQETEGKDSNFVSPETVPANLKSPAKSATKVPNLMLPPNELHTKTSDWSTAMQKADLQSFDGAKRVFQDEKQSEAPKLPMSTTGQIREPEMKATHVFWDHWLPEQTEMQPFRQGAKVSHDREESPPFKQPADHGKSHEGEVTGTQGFQESSQWNKVPQWEAPPPSQDVTIKERHFELVKKPVNAANQGQNQEGTVMATQPFEHNSSWSSISVASTAEPSRDMPQVSHATKESHFAPTTQPANAPNHEAAKASQKNTHWSMASQKSGTQPAQETKMPPTSRENHDEAAKLPSTSSVETAQLPDWVHTNPAAQQYLARIDALQTRLETLFQENSELKERVDKVERKMLADENRQLRERIQQLENSDQHITNRAKI